MSQLPPGCHLLNQTKQIIALHTIIRDKRTGRDDFVFYSDRLIRLLIEEGLNYLPFTENPVTTPTEATYPGTRLKLIKINPRSLPKITTNSSTTLFISINSRKLCTYATCLTSWRRVLLLGQSLRSLYHSRWRKYGSWFTPSNQSSEDRKDSNSTWRGNGSSQGSLHVPAFCHILMPGTVVL